MSIKKRTQIPTENPVSQRYFAFRDRN